MNKILEILKEEKPYDHLFELHQKGDLRELFPELVDLETTTSGHKNNFKHTLSVLKNVCDFNDNYKMRIVALFHDIGKMKTRRKKGESDWTFHNHEAIGAEMTLEIFKRWGVTDTDLINYVYKMIYFHGRTKMHRDVSESAIRRITVEVGIDILPDLIDFCKCDLTTAISARRERIVTALDKIKDRVFEVRDKDEKAKWRSPLTGNIIMEILGVGKGRIIGDIKQEFDPQFKANTITLDEAIEYIKLNKSKWLN